MAEANAVSTEALRNIRTVRSFGADLLVPRRKNIGIFMGKTMGKPWESELCLQVLRYIPSNLVGILGSLPQIFRYHTHMALESHGRKRGFEMSMILKSRIFWGHVGWSSDEELLPPPNCDGWNILKPSLRNCWPVPDSPKEEVDIPKL